MWERVWYVRWINGVWPEVALLGSTLGVPCILCDGMCLLCYLCACRGWGRRVERVYALGQRFSDPEAGQILAQRLRQRLLGSTHASLAFCVVIYVVVVYVCVMN